jgi:hypothetical protein
MNLEPRLQEYLQRRDFFKNNDMDTKLLEKQYMITPTDKQVMNMYLNKNVYKKKDLEKNMYCDFIEVSKEKATDPNDIFRSDKRFERLRNKVEKEKAANMGRNDISEISRNYDLFNSSGFASMGGNFNSPYESNRINNNNFNYNNQNDINNNDTIIDTINDTNNDTINDTPNDNYFDKAFPKQLQNNTREKSTRVKDNSYHYQRQKEVHVTPKIQYNQRVYNDQYDSYTAHTPTLDNIVGDISSYKNKVNNTYAFNSDAEFGGVRFNRNDCKQADYDRMYGKVGEMTGGELKNIDIETYIKFGSPTSKAKSLGFENPVDHHFSFIDSDIQNPNHIVNERPQLSRLSNKESVNYKGRNIY